MNSNVFCPFNSQDTFWSNEFFMYMYLPISVTFRMTDILRGYVAQRCLWEHNAHLGFFGPNMIQLRNEHNLLNDFSLEIPCFTQVETIINILTEIKLGSSPKNNLKKIYAKLNIDYTVSTNTNTIGTAPNVYSGTAGQTTFTIKKVNSSTSYGVNDVLVFWQGLCLEPTTDYTISGTTLTFDQSVKAGDHIVVRYLPVSG